MRKKVYAVIGLIAAISLSFGSTVLGLSEMRETKAAEIVTTDAEKSGKENSWRYKNGKVIENEQNTSKAARKAVKPSNATAWGIDVSYHDGSIDWAKVKKSGVDYAIIRCGYGKNKKSQDDKKWTYNSSQCEKLGIPYGVYLYSYATTTSAAKSEAQHVIRLLQGKKLSYPIYYDLEDESQRNLGAKKLGEIATTFLNTIKSAGYKNVGVYANTDWFTNRLTASVFNQHPRWVAQYNTSCKFKGSYHMWQYTEKGKVNGINTYVDLNYKIGKWDASQMQEPGIYMKESKVTLTNGKSKTLGVTNILKDIQETIETEEGTQTVIAPKDYTIKWSSSDKNTVSVNSKGKMKAKKPGKAKITAANSDGKRATCTVTVKPKTNKVKKLKKKGKKSIKITWTKVSGVTKYQIYMSKKKKSGYKKIKTASSKNSSYTKGKLKKGKRYYFKVRSYKKIGGKYYYSAFSSVKSMKR